MATFDRKLSTLKRILYMLKTYLNVITLRLERVFTFLIFKCTSRILLAQKKKSLREKLFEIYAWFVEKLHDATLKKEIYIFQVFLFFIQV